jgi:hypothetical protein
VQITEKHAVGYGNGNVASPAVRFTVGTYPHCKINPFGITEYPLADETAPIDEAPNIRAVEFRVAATELLPTTKARELMTALTVELPMETKSELTVRLPVKTSFCIVTVLVVLSKLNEFEPAKLPESSY